jgi:hypothetical protein
MTIRTSVTSGSWQQIGTGPATVQLISPDSNQATVMVYAGAAQPGTNSDGLAMNSEFHIYQCTEAQPIWAQVVQAGETALMAVQPEAT